MHYSRWFVLIFRNLQHNLFTRLEAAQLNSLSQLRTLRLSNNKLSSIAPQAFLQISSLEAL